VVTPVWVRRITQGKRTKGKNNDPEKDARSLIFLEKKDITELLAKLEGGKGSHVRTQHVRAPNMERREHERSLMVSKEQVIGK